MTLTVAVQMDPIQRIKIAGDRPSRCCSKRSGADHRLLHYTPDRLSMRDGRVDARVEPIEVRDVEGDHARWASPSASTSPPWTWC